MTDEELKNKCTERAKIFQQAMESCKSSSLIDCIEWFADRIAELEKENTELKVKNKWYSEQVCNKECAEVWGELTKAKEIIKRLIESIHKWDYKNLEQVEAEAEQFLKENENDN